MNILYDYLFHYNPYQKMWYTFKRENHTKFFNGDKRGSMKNEDLDELVTDILIKHKTNETKN